MRQHFLTFITAALALVGTADARAAAAPIENFEDGLPSSWSTTGNAWSVVHRTGVSVHILSPEGARVATSGSPGSASESFTGTLTSGPLVVGFESIQWKATGWSGFSGDGTNRFEILDGRQDVVGTVAAPLSDVWTTQDFSLTKAGFQRGDIFHFRVVDSNSGLGYAWLAVDALQFSGAALPVPEPTAPALLASGLALLAWRVRSRHR